jgi:hypothetical protein
VLDSQATQQTLRLEGDIPLGVPMGYEEIVAAITSDKKSVLPRHLGILGTTGGGKSTTVSGLAASFQQAGIATILIDTEGEYTQIFQPTSDPTMLAALEKRGRQPHGVENVFVCHLVGRETTCPDRRRTRAFSLQFCQLSPYLVMGVLPDQSMVSGVPRLQCLLAEHVDHTPGYPLISMLGQAHQRAAFGLPIEHSCGAIGNIL